MYKVTEIKVDEVSFLRGLNSMGKAPLHHNKIEIHLKRTYKLSLFNVSLFNITKNVVAEGYLHKNQDINKYLKPGDSFNLEEYPMLKIKK